MLAEQSRRSRAKRKSTTTKTSDDGKPPKPEKGKDEYVPRLCPKDKGDADQDSTKLGVQIGR